MSRFQNSDGSLRSAGLLFRLCWTFWMGFLCLNWTLCKPIQFLLPLHRKPISKIRKQETGGHGQEVNSVPIPPKSSSIYPVLSNAQRSRTVCVWPWMCHYSQSGFQEPPTVPGALTVLWLLLTADFTLYGHSQLPACQPSRPISSFSPLAEPQHSRPVDPLIGVCKKTGILCVCVNSSSPLSYINWFW